jgi:uncharacterized protein (DUF2141 family)
MSTFSFIVFLFLTLGLIIRESDSQPNYQLTVFVHNVKPGKGLVRVCLFDNEKDFFGNARQCIVVAASGQRESVQVVFDDLEDNTYAVAVYQDLNHNGILDLNWLGIPSEPYGFSNNPSTLFGPPNFSKASFEVQLSRTIFVRL